MRVSDRKRKNIYILLSSCWTVFSAIYWLWGMPKGTGIERLYLLFSNVHFVFDGIIIGVLLFLSLGYKNRRPNRVYAVNIGAVCVVFVLYLVLRQYTTGRSSLWSKELTEKAIAENTVYITTPITPLIYNLMDTVSPSTALLCQICLDILHVFFYITVFNTIGFCVSEHLSYIITILLYLFSREAAFSWPIWGKYIPSMYCFLQNDAKWCPFPEISMNIGLGIIVAAICSCSVILMLKTKEIGDANE